MARAPFSLLSADNVPCLSPAYLDLDELVRDLGCQLVREKGQLRVRKIQPQERTLALALSGGGAAGAYEAGVIETLVGRLRERGIKIDLLVGTSAGALNAFGLFLDELDQANPQLRKNPDLRQPYTTFVASLWSYLDRDHRTSTWVVGRRAWMVHLASRWLQTRWVRRLAVGLLILLAAALNPYLSVYLWLLLQGAGVVGAAIDTWRFSADYPDSFAALGLVSLALFVVLALLLVRSFRFSLFKNVPLLRLLANTGRTGDLSRNWRWGRGKTIDRARVLSRDLIQAWYKHRDDAPELIVTATNLSLGNESLFTLVRPATYRRLVDCDWMAVQLDPGTDAAEAYRVEGSLFTLGENLLSCVVSSTSIPGAFPAQPIGLYGRDGAGDVRHFFVDGGVLNNTPIHIAIDANATHVISLELDPLGFVSPTEVDERGQNYHLLRAGVGTFRTLLGLATEEDIRRAIAWNRFLVRHPRLLKEGQCETGWRKGEGVAPKGKRVVPLYRIAPRRREIGTLEFDGHFERGQLVVSLRDWLRRGLVDLQGQAIWRATLRPDPGEEWKRGVAQAGSSPPTAAG